MMINMMIMTIVNCCFLDLNIDSILFQVNAKNKNGDTPLIIACASNDAESGTVLLEAEADVNIANCSGISSLFVISDPNLDFEVLDIFHPQFSPPPPNH